MAGVLYCSKTKNRYERDFNVFNVLNFAKIRYTWGLIM